MKLFSTTFGSLRPWKPQDADALVKYANNRNISMNMRDVFVYLYTTENASKFLEAAIQHDSATNYTIAIPEDTFDGIGLTVNSDVHRQSAELGYRLAEPLWS